MSARIIRLILAFVSLAVAGVIAIIAAHLPSRQDPLSTPSRAPTESLRLEILDKGTISPDFSLKDLRGETVRLRDLRGKVVFLNFWATWCSPCLLEMPTMEKLHNELRGELVILAINLRERPEKIRAFFKAKQLSFTALLDETGTVFEAYQVWSLPTTYIIGKKGEIAGKAMGYRNWHDDQSKSFFRRLLND